MVLWSIQCNGWTRIYFPIWIFQYKIITSKLGLLVDIYRGLIAPSPAAQPGRPLLALTDQCSGGLLQYTNTVLL